MLETTMGAQSVDDSGRSSPRGERAEAALVDAVLDLIDESGVAGLSVDKIALRARVGKPTLYRRWNNKEELVAFAMGHSEVPPEIDGDGPLDATLVTVLSNLTDRLTLTRVGRVWCRLIGSDERYSEATRLYAEEFIAPRVDALVQLLQREIASGTLRDDIDPHATVGMMISTVVGEVVNVHPSGHIRPSAEAIVDTYLRGLRAARPGRE